MSSNPIRLKFLLKKYLDNACSGEDLEEFWQLMSELSDNDLVHQELQELWGRKEDTQIPARDELDRVFHRVQQKIDRQEAAHAPAIRHGSNRKLYLSVAASLLILLSVGWWYANRSAGGLVATFPPATAQALRVIRLPDGSTVTLNRNSRLDFPTTFSGSSREVTLTGEAFFDIHHDPSKPFLVHTGAFVTRVLGTAFNIKAYDKDSLVAITVERGRVQVQRSKDQQPLKVLTAGDQLVIDKQSQVPFYAKADVKQVTEWTTTDLTFDNIRFEEASIAIGRHFGIHLQFGEVALRDCRFTVDLTDKSIEEMLDILCQLTRSSWKWVGAQTIRLEGEGCKNQ